jgi:hypothetical protein
MSAWPPKRPGKKSEAQLETMRLFKDACIAMKRMDATVQNTARDASKGTPMLPRDALLAQLYGKGPVVFATNGTRLVPMPNAIGISDLLDMLDWTPGTMLFRGQDLWIPIPPGNENDLLRFRSAKHAPEWVQVPELNQAKSTCFVVSDAEPAEDAGFYHLTFAGTLWDDLAIFDADHPDRIRFPEGRSRFNANIALRLARNIAGGEEWETVEPYRATGMVETDTYSGYTVRNAMGLVIDGIPATQIRFEILASNAGQVVTDMFFGQATNDGTPYSFTTPPTQVTFRDGDASVTMPPNERLWSDWIDLPAGVRNRLVTSFHVATTSPFGGPLVPMASPSGWHRAYKNTGSASQAGVMAFDGWGNWGSDRTCMVSAIEVRQLSGGGEEPEIGDGFYTLAFALEDDEGLDPTAPRFDMFTTPFEREDIALSWEGGWREFPSADFVRLRVNSQDWQYRRPVAGSLVVVEWA